MAIKFSEKARVEPEKLSVFVRKQSGATFTPSGVLRLDLTEEEIDDVLSLAHGALLELRPND